MRSIDSIQRPTPKSTVRPTAPQPVQTGARFTGLQTAKSRRKLPWSFIISLLVSPVLFGLAFIGIIGVGFVAAYGIVSLVLRLPSRDSFGLALMALLYMAGASIAGQKGLAQALATLAYVVLAIGAISLAREVKSARGVWFKKH